MADLLKRLESEVLVVDGAMGTMLQRAGVPAEQCPEQLNVTAPEIVAAVHRDYRLAGAECVTTNTFGGTRIKLAEYGLGDQVAGLNRAAVRLARDSGAPHVLGDVGPTGKVLEPLGEASFDEVFAAFAEQVEALASEGPDAIIIETMTDVAEARCALLAARSVTDLPVIACLTFGLAGRTELSGTDPETAAAILRACGASAVGLNCGLGPSQMLPLVESFAAATDLPIAVLPNAGLPRLEEGVTVFPGTPEEMGEAAEAFLAAGASLIGSCCGTSPAFTGAIADAVGGKPPKGGRTRPRGVAVAGPRRVVRIGGGDRLVVVGERINPTGRKPLAQSLREGSLALVREAAVAQQHEGAELLDVNVGAAGVDAARMLPDAVGALAALADTPLVLDSTDPAALQPALRLYPGRALVNSVNGSPEALRDVLPLAARFGAAIVALALDENGIPETAEGRVAIVRRIRDAALAQGLRDEDIVADCLTLTAATSEQGSRVTIDAVRGVAGELGLATILGVSNVSHGLPGRSALNATFLALAVEAGLSSAILDPADLRARESAAAADVLLGRDPRAERWIALSRAEERAEGPRPEALGASVAERLTLAIENGDAASSPALVEEFLGEGRTPQQAIADVLTPAIQRLGEAFGRGEVFLPQLLVAADAMKAAVDRAKEALPAAERTFEGRVAFATVRGDVHSIGKDICVSLLESSGFEVDDLGVDVPAERVAEAAASADVVCLSALMTTTLPAMEAAASDLRAAGVPVLVGGAVVTEEYATSIGAGWASDAPGCVSAVRTALAARKGA